MGSYPYEGIAIRIYPHLLKGIASKGLDYEIIVMIILLILHNSNKIRWVSLVIDYLWVKCGYCL
jgi:hypothetical protein